MRKIGNLRLGHVATSSRPSYSSRERERERERNCAEIDHDPVATTTSDSVAIPSPLEAMGLKMRFGLSIYVVSSWEYISFEFSHKKRKEVNQNAQGSFQQRPESIWQQLHGLHRRRVLLHKLQFGWVLIPNLSNGPILSWYPSLRDLKPNRKNIA